MIWVKYIITKIHAIYISVVVKNKYKKSKNEIEDKNKRNKQCLHCAMCSRVACPKFGHPVQSSEFQNYALNTEFAVTLWHACMLRKMKTIFKSWNKFNPKSLFKIFTKLFFQKNYILTDKCPNFGQGVRT